MMHEGERASDNSIPHALLRHVSGIYLFFSFAYISLRVALDYRAAGNAWKQGDWLINNAAGPVRRGPFGSAIISISDFANLNPLLLVSAIQLALLAILFFAFLILLAEIRSAPIVLLLAISSAIFTVFWAADPQGSVRKELIAFAGITIYGIGALQKNWALLWLGVALFCVATVAHEAMVLFAPTFLAIAAFSGLHKESAIQSTISIATVFCFSAFAFIFAIRHSGAEDTAQICAALTARGLNDAICAGAIRWLSYDSAYGFEQVISRVGLRSGGGFLISYAAALAPFAYLIWLSKQRVLMCIALILLALPFVPLYIVAVDWGRWMSFHVFSVTVVFACAIIKNRFEIQRSVNLYYVLSLVSLAVLISPRHTIGVIWGGAVREAGSIFWRLVN